MCGDDRGWRPAPHIGDEVRCNPQTVLSAVAGARALNAHVCAMGRPARGLRGRTPALAACHRGFEDSSLSFRVARGWVRCMGWPAYHCVGNASTDSTAGTVTTWATARRQRAFVNSLRTSQTDQCVRDSRKCIPRVRALRRWNRAPQRHLSRTTAVQFSDAKSCHKSC